MGRRRLTDLYVRGMTVTFDDGEGPSETVYLQKLNPVEMETALRKANAARARTTAEFLDEESDAYVTNAVPLKQMTRDEMIDHLIVSDVVKKQPVVESEIGDEDEWKERDYLEGLKDAWDDLMVDYFSDEPSEEATRVHDELNRFNEQVRERMEGEKASFRRDYDARTDEKMRDMILQQSIEQQADLQWIVEYRKQEVYFGTREEENHKTRYFESRAELDELAPEILSELVIKYQDLVVEVPEGKDSPQPQSSSPQSDSPQKQAEEADSGQAA